MILTALQGYVLVAKHGCYVTEFCDKCGGGLGPVRFTRRDDSGVWCSRECRDGKDAHAPGTCKGCGARLPEGKRRGAAFCDAACKQAGHRRNGNLQKARMEKLSVTNPSIYAGFCTGKSLDGISGHPRLFS